VTPRVPSGLNVALTTAVIGGADGGPTPKLEPLTFAVRAAMGGARSRDRVYVVGSTPQISAPFWYRVTVCVSLYTKLGSEMKE